jgi:plastocyanin domain-containing protein
MINKNLRARLGRIALIAFVRGTATATGTAIIGLITWWITHR